MNKNLTFAFTLSELLICLTILGVIASITVPIIMTNYEQNVLNAKILKADSLLLNVTDIIMTKNNGYFPRVSTGVEPDTLRDMYSTFMRYMKTCETGKSNMIECWNENGGYSYSNTRVKYNGDDWWFGSDKSSALLADGIGLIFNDKYSTYPCKKTTDPYDNNARCARIFVDVNGPTRPNAIGHDILIYYIYKTEGVKPYGDGTLSDCLTQESRCSAYAVIKALGATD